MIIENRIENNTCILSSQEAIILANELLRASDEAKDHHLPFNVDLISLEQGNFKIKVKG